MYELIQHLIAFKYACKINHWSTDNYSKHLLFDRLSEDIDDWVDSIAETYFMATGNKKVFNANALKQNKKPVFLLEGQIDTLSIIDCGGIACTGLNEKNTFIDFFFSKINKKKHSATIFQVAKCFFFIVLN